MTQGVKNITQCVISKGIKAVRKFNESMYCSLLERYARVFYQVGKKTHPVMNCGPLCIFKDVYSTLRFLKYNGISCKKIHIFTCDYIRSNDTKIWAPRSVRASGEYNSMTWAHLTSGALPAGTILADWVELKREVTDYEELNELVKEAE